MKRLLWVIVCSVLSQIAIAGEATGDLYGGAVFPYDQAVRTDVSGNGTDITDYSGSHLTDGPQIGGRIGYMFTGDVESISLGAVLDISWTSYEAGVTDVHIVPISPMLLVRWPIFGRHEEKKGDYALQGYAAAGPSLVVGWIQPPRSSALDSGDDLALGFDARVGLRLDFGGPFTVMVEYRFLYTQLEFDGAATLGGLDFDVTSRMDVVAHFVGFGIGF